jgi:fermentation-respiration switch protein FrsA (DUF1100 family)
MMRAGAAVSLLLLSGCAGLASRPGVFDASRQDVVVGGRTYHVTYVKPPAPGPRKPLIALFTGDAGWLGTSGVLLEHLAGAGYSVAGFDSREALKPVRQSGDRVSVSRAAETLEEAYARAKSDLGLPASTPLVVVGFSRGATVVAFTAVHPRLQAGLAGAIAIALTRESDFLKAPDPADRPPEVQVDEEGRIQLYPALGLIGSIPLAVIQSTGDKYVPSAESRRLLGPDTPTRRLYEVEARNHGFSGGDETLLRDLDDALRWIAP